MGPYNQIGNEDFRKSKARCWGLLMFSQYYFFEVCPNFYNYKISTANDKPDPVDSKNKFWLRVIIYLPPILLLACICLPSPAANVANNKSNSASNATPKSRGVHGISIHKVYSPNRLLCSAVRSYRTFSPLPRLTVWRLFSATLSVFRLGRNPIR